MPHTELVRFTPAHALALAPRPQSLWGMNWAADLESVSHAYALAGPACTLLAGTTPVACGGVVLLWPGVGEAWCLASPLVERHPLALCKAARSGLAAMATAQGLHRVQAHALEHDTRAAAWLEWLGFTREALCEAYGPHRENTIQYRRIHT